jgi:hypothetical protein
LLADPARGQTFSFSKDTVYETASAFHPEGDSVGLTNLTSDTLVMDSINVIRDTAVFPDVHVELHVRPFSGMGVYAGGYYFSTQYYYPLYGDAQTPCIRLKGMATVFLLDFYLDCYPRPLPKRAAADGDAITLGDTISVRLAFVSGTFSDTLTIVGVYDPVSVRTDNNSLARCLRPLHSVREFSLTGQQIGFRGDNGCSVVAEDFGDGRTRCRVTGLTVTRGRAH